MRSLSHGDAARSLVLGLPGVSWLVAGLPGLGINISIQLEACVYGCGYVYGVSGWAWQERDGRVMEM